MWTHFLFHLGKEGFFFICQRRINYKQQKPYEGLCWNSKRIDYNLKGTAGFWKGKGKETLAEQKSRKTRGKNESEETSFSLQKKLLQVCGAMDAYHPHCLALSTTDWLSIENHQDSEHYRGHNVVRSINLKETIFKHNLQRKNVHPFPFKGSRTMGLKYFQLSIQGGILADMIIPRFSCIGSYYLF